MSVALMGIFVGTPSLPRLRLLFTSKCGIFGDMAADSEAFDRTLEDPLRADVCPETWAQYLVY